MRVVLAASAVALAPASAFAVDYLSAEQAAKLMFPDADRFESCELTLDAAQLQKLDAQGVRARSARWPLRVAQRGGATLGFVVVDEVIGKFELISYAVGIGLDGAVKQVEVLSYRESHGHEIRLPAWRRQFIGKTAASPLRVGEDIANISGATLSCSHVTEGVRRIVSVVDAARRSGSLQ
ncbi:FMN-binding protein [Piscinibacter sp.]|jgi:Na+-translocating ferredoxin:NAD+ oxidoreductase RnfG subunit|uniref:FMN-binding protein n=1 Tax=Piscinibacter sp. TaxID=1903157 RepID=UPI002F425869